eukprot:NODE_1893_length_1571_cov_134.115331_g1801_i0.p1 GENE.NODE_1893_length_1571_cov_134.115331_g1801_i0~~NODE_1893_length_1571_cov_134.115331_g1801_i0.p1  ORF type:complete len:465 (+),score=72.94 NODE_1893_length_1571_cov_134.115331_g1801_i0:111-1505(+)
MGNTPCGSERGEETTEAERRQQELLEFKRDHQALPKHLETPVVEVAYNQPPQYEIIPISASLEKPWRPSRMPVRVPAAEIPAAARLWQGANAVGNRGIVPVPLDYNDIGQPSVPIRPYPYKFVPKMSRAVAVTGAGGYLGSHIVRALVQAGYQHIRCGVTGKDSCRHLRALDPARRVIAILPVDPSRPHGMDELIEGCEVVLHADPCLQEEGDDPYYDTVLPVVLGTQEVLNACERFGVRKVVATFSTQAVHEKPRKMNTEADWNTTSTALSLPSFYAQAKAEAVFWQFAQDHPTIQCVSLLPTALIGPYLDAVRPPALSKLIASLMGVGVNGGTANDYVLPMDVCVTDVRDVAQANLHAMESSMAYGRYLCAEGSNQWERDVVAMLCSDFPELAVCAPRVEMDVPACRRMYKTAKKERHLSILAGRRLRYDSSRIREELAVNFIDFHTSLVETVLCLQDNGHI